MAQYGLISKIFHGVTIGLFVYLIYLGLTMTGMDNSPEKWGVYAQHKQVGFIALIVGFMRLMWSEMTPDVIIVSGSNFHRLLARIVHSLLYLCILVIPLSGVYMSFAGGHGLDFFGYQIDLGIEKSDDLASIAKLIHLGMINVFYALVCFHLAGVIHGLIKKSGSFSKMFSFRP